MFNPKSIAIDAVLGAAGVGIASKATDLISSSRIARLPTNLARSKAVGQLDEDVMGIAQTGKRGVKIGGKTVFPDRLTTTALDEVKNVSAIRTRDAAQITAEANYAAQNGLSMNVYIRPGADVSKVRSLIDNGAFSVKNIPGIGSNGYRILKDGEAAVVGGVTGVAVNALK